MAVDVEADARDVAEHADDLHQRAIVVDAVGPRMDDPNHWADWIVGGATVVAPTIAALNDVSTTIAALGNWLVWLKEHPSELIHVRSVTDIHLAKMQRKLGVLFHFQGGDPIGSNVDHLDVYHKLGVRMIQLCYNRRNLLGDGSGEPADAGLSNLGRAAVQRMNALGIVVDVSHTGYRSSMEAIAASSVPCVFSHSNPRELCDNGRNIRDDQIKAIAERGGLVGLGAFPAFVVSSGSPTIEDWLNHVDYVVNLIGPDHVGLGMDWFTPMTPTEYADALKTYEWYAPDYPPPPHIYPTGLEDARALPAITAALLRRGYTQSDVKWIMGESWLRVFRTVWHDE